MRIRFYHLSWDSGTVTQLQGFSHEAMKNQLEERCANMQMACNVVSDAYEVVGRCEKSHDTWTYVGKALA